MGVSGCVASCGVAVSVVLMGVLAGCADGPPSRPSAQPPPPATPVAPVVTPAAAPVEAGAAAVASPKPTVQSPASQRPRAPTSAAAHPPEVLATAPARNPAPHASRKAVVSCTTTPKGQGSYETADIVCKNTTRLIHTVYLDINASGYTNLPSAAAIRGAICWRRASPSGWPALRWCHARRRWPSTPAPCRSKPCRFRVDPAVTHNGGAPFFARNVPWSRFAF